jgi:methionine synthase II (cobalamin-independent)
MDTVPRGYRIASRRSAAARRAVSLLDEDVDALEEAWERAGLRGSARTVKVQAPGPITLAAQLELSGGHRALTDAGAVRDLAESLTEGLALHRAELARRLGAHVVLQLDEPLLPAALAGRLTGVTGLSAVHPVDEAVATGLLDDCIDGVGGDVAFHCCAADVPWRLLQRSKFHAVSLDASQLVPADLDGIGEFVESGRVVMLGVVPTTEPVQRLAPEQIATTAASVTDRLGFARTILRERVGITPACGLASATAGWARTAIDLTQKVADGIALDPDSV